MPSSARPLGRATLSPVDRSIKQPALLGADDPAPYAILQENGAAAALVVCDHASRAIPKSLNRLGLPELATWQHVAWDIGAGELARGLAAMLDAPAVLAGYSRLVVDCNRRPDDPDAFRQVSDGWEIPGNAALDDDARRRRLARLLRPLSRLHRGAACRTGAAVSATVAGVRAHLHSASERSRSGHGTSACSGTTMSRPHGGCSRGCAGTPTIVVGDNEPYSGKHPSDFTIDHHAGARRAAACLHRGAAGPVRVRRRHRTLGADPRRRARGMMADRAPAREGAVQ